MNVRGNQLYDQWAEDLKFHLIRPAHEYGREHGAEYMDGIYDIFTTAVINGDQIPCSWMVLVLNRLNPSYWSTM